MYMDDIKLFAKNGKELEPKMKTIRIYNLDIGIEFSIEKCTMLIKKRKRQIMDVIELQNQKRNKTLGDNGNYIYL